MKRVLTPRLTIGILVALVAFGAFLRVHDLAGDAPLRLSWSQAPFTDGARVLDGARNRIMHDRWIIDPRNPAVAHYPLSNLLGYVLFSAFGVGIAQAGLLSALAGIVSVGAMAFTLYRRAAPAAAILGTLFFAVDYQMIMYDRLPMSEALMISLMVVASAVLIETLSRVPADAGARGPSARGLALAGLLVGLDGFFVKLHALLLLPVGALAIMGTLAAGRGWFTPRVKRALSWYAGSILAMGVVWFLVVVIPESGAMGRFLQANVVGHYNYGREHGGFLDLLDRFFRKRLQGLFAFGVNVTFLWRTCVAALVSLLVLIGFIAGLPGRMRRSAPARLHFALWLGLGILAVSLLDYRPDRYHMMMLPPICALAGIGLSEILGGSGTWKPPALRGRIAWLAAGAGFFAGYQVVGEGGRLMVWYSQNIYNFLTSLGLDGDRIMNTVGVCTQGFWKPTFTALAIGAALNAGYALWRRRVLARGGFRLAAARRETMVLAVVILGVSWQLGQYLSWSRQVKYTMRDAGRDLGEILSPGAVVLGSVATTLCLENRLDSVPVYGDIMRRQDNAGLASYPVTHVLYREEGLRPFLEKNFPEVVRGQVFVRSYQITGQLCELWRVPDWPGARGVSPRYEPSNFEKGIALLQQNRAGEAIPFFEEFRRAHPDNASACIVLGACYSETGRGAEALALFERAVNLRPDDPAVLEDLGDLYLRANQERKAEEMWTRALRLEPGNKDLEKRLTMLRGRGREGFLFEDERERQSSSTPPPAPPLFGGDER